jgi:hypothetical protein
MSQWSDVQSKESEDMTSGNFEGFKWRAERLGAKAALRCCPICLKNKRCQDSTRKGAGNSWKKSRATQYRPIKEV